MSLQQAFGITEDDVSNVLRANSKALLDSTRDLDKYASQIFDELTGEDLDRVAQAALDSGVELDEQTDGAYTEMRTLLTERGVLLPA